MASETAPGKYDVDILNVICSDTYVKHTKQTVSCEITDYS